MDYPRDKLARDFFATLALTVFAQARNWQLGHEKYASILFATLALTVFGHSPKLAPQLWKICKHIFRSIRLNSFCASANLVGSVIYTKLETLVS